MKIKNVKQAQPISDLKVEADCLYFFIGNDRQNQFKELVEEHGIPAKQVRALVFTRSLEGLAKWALVVLDGYDPNQLTQALNFRPKQVFNGLAGDDDTGSMDGNPSTPLEKAVLHLMKIGSTNQKELQAMAKAFVTEKAACEKLGISFYLYAQDRIKKQLEFLRITGNANLILLVTDEFYASSGFENKQLFEAFFCCSVKIDNNVENYSFTTGGCNVPIQ